MISRKRIRFLTIFIVFISVGLLIYREQLFRKKLENRALIAVVETNSYLTESDIAWYKDNKEPIDMVIAILTPATYSELEAMPVESVLDKYVEDMLGNLILLAGNNYDRKILLSDEHASTANLERVLSENASDGIQIDLLILAHGSDNNLYLNNEFVNVLKYGNYLQSKDFPLGYVYNSACYGSTHAKSWIDAGALVSNGSKTSNSFVIFSPILFEYYWTHGYTFEEAVKQAYVWEYRVWKFANILIPGVSNWLGDATKLESEMVIIGDGNLKN